MQVEAVLGAALELKKEKKNLDYKKQILFVCPYPQGVQAGQRLKYEQYFNYLDSKGLKCELANIITEKDDKVLYTSRNILKKGLIKI